MVMVMEDQHWRLGMQRRDEGVEESGSAHGKATEKERRLVYSVLRPQRKVAMG
jgi:hypothetical protein